MPFVPGALLWPVRSHHQAPHESHVPDLEGSACGIPSQLYVSYVSLLQQRAVAPHKYPNRPLRLLLRLVTVTGAKRQVVDSFQLCDLFKSFLGNGVLPSSACSTMSSSRSPNEGPSVQQEPSV